MRGHLGPRRTRAPLAVAGVFLALAGCELIPGSKQYLAAGIQARMDYNNTKAAVLSQAPCDMPVGGYHRMLNDVQKTAVDALCGGDFESLRKLIDAQAKTAGADIAKGSVVEQPESAPIVLTPPATVP